MDILLWTFLEPQIVIQCPYFVGYVINIWSTVSLQNPTWIIQIFDYPNSLLLSHFFMNINLSHLRFITTFIHQTKQNDALR